MQKGAETLAIFSYFDTSNHPSGKKPERFYRGFVLGQSIQKGACKGHGALSEQQKTAQQLSGDREFNVFCG